jgi:uncharacterized protein DUF6599
MRKRSWIFIVLMVVCSAQGAAAGPVSLPDGFGSWQAAGEPHLKSGPSLYQGYGNVRPDVLREAGLLTGEDRSYTRGSDKLQLTLLTFKDPSGAYEFYTSILTPSMIAARLGDESAVDANQGLILVGNFVLTTGPLQDVKPDELADLVKVLKLRADHSPYPPLRQYLPTTWRVFGTEKYSQGPVGFVYAMDSLGQGALRALSDEAGFNEGAEAIFAKYQGTHGSGTLLLLEYPTPQVAENRLHHIRQALPVDARQAGVTVERKASLLSLVFAPTSAMHAQAIRDEVNYETNVTWNEPSQTATDPPLVYMMFKIFLFTSLFLVVATVMGVFFGGLRILIKHWLPGKIFDRPQDIEVLQLGLSGKKIDPSDMY